ncbi:pseudouridine synthase [Ostreibacterium oceani]|uniref:Pseudouridine synthase n=1 Tax=Ostreibacterium oceani TaxID=2654998 RepID=A0A6N7EZE0_9GAMM|nr:pseudouridine synthase [Ostreibacterium oceani]
MPAIILLNKPYNCLSQFTDDSGRDNLSHYIKVTGFYPAGRLDYDSEGLLILTNNGRLQAQITDPAYAKPKTYLAQVEGEITKSALADLRQGVCLKDGITRPAKAVKCGPPKLWPRNPPIRYRQQIPTSWVKLTITEGRNRQVRRMLAHVGFPCLRLVRLSVGDWHLQDLQPGQSRKITYQASKR